jgi:hypothetical protein
LIKGELHAHWQLVGTTDPSLPNRASKAFLRMYRIFRSAFEQANGDEAVFRQTIATFVPGPPPRKRGTKVLPSVAAVARPEIDVDRLVAALMRLIDMTP